MQKVPSRAAGGPVILRAGGGPVILRAGGGPIILRAGGGPIIPRSGYRFVTGGWHPDIPDLRDYDLDTPAFKQPMQDANIRLASYQGSELPSRVDLRRFCSPVEDQDTLGSCTAHAVVGMLEYMMRRGLDEHTDLSRLFLYRVTRRLLGWTGDIGAHIRTTIKAAVCFGVPPEQYWPYEISRFDEEPDAFLYRYADNFKAMKYARLDSYNASGQSTLDAIKRVLDAGFVVAFGFPVYDSMTESPYVPPPTPRNKLQGGHAVLAVGYDDKVQIEDSDGRKTDGCLIFRNSWGEPWGDNGYGYLSYDYVLRALAVDFWTVYRSEWIAEGRFA